MNDKKRIALIAGLAVMIVACIGASVFTGQVPVYTGGLIIAAVVGGLAAWLVKHIKDTPPKARLETEQTAELPSPRTELADRYRKILRESCTEISENALLVQMPVNLLPGCIVNMTYHCWKTDDSLIFFPMWDSLEATLGLVRYLDNGFTAEHVRIDCLRVPLSSIICFNKEPYRHDMRPVTLLHYRNQVGDSVGLLMQEDAHSALKTMIPAHDLGIIEIQRYPQSSRQILDITTKLQQLKTLHMQSLIDEEEYSAKKNQLLTTL